MTIRFTSAALACMAALSASSVLAASQATATIDNLTFTLYDLDLTDNVSPSFKFLTDQASAGSTTTSAQAYDQALGESGTDSLTRNVGFQARVADVSLGNALAISVVDGYSVAAHGQAAGSATQFNASAATSAGRSPG